MGLIFISIISASLVFCQVSPFYFGTGEAVNLTNGIAYQNGVKNIAGSLNPSSIAVNAPAGSMYYSTSGTIYVKQDAGLSTNWLPLGIATTLNGQSGPNINIATGSSGSDFNISSASNTITLNLPTASATVRGLLSLTDWSTFNGKQDAITGAASTVTSSNLTANRAVISNGSGKLAVSAVTDTELGYVSGVTSPVQTQIDGKEPTIASGTTSQYWRGDKSWQTLDKSAVGLSNVDNTSDANKPISTATQTALNAKVDGAASSVDSEVMLYSGTTGKASKRATGSGYAKLTSGVLSTSATVPTSDLTGQVSLANGGTNKNMTASAGAVVVSDADSMELTAVGTSGQILQSNGTSAPSFVNKSISGKAQNKTAVTLEEIQVPNNQLTLVTGSKYLAETGNKNILDDASFEGSNASGVWTLTTGSYISDNTPIDGVFNGLLTLSSQSLAFVQDSTLYQSQFADGVQGLASIRVRTSVTSTPIYVCYRQAGNSGAIGSGCVQVQANGKWGLYKVPFILGATSNGIIVTSNAVAITGDVEVDDAFVGAVDLKQDINVVGPWTTGTCTSTWTTTATVSCKYRQVGQDIEVSGALTANGAVTATSLSVSTPSGFTIDFSKVATAETNQIHSGFASFIDTPSSTIYQGRTLLIDSTNIQILSSNASATIAQPNGVSNTSPFTFGSGDIINFNYKVPVTQFSGASSVYTSQNADTDWASCGHTTSDFTGFGTVTNIETQCKREGSDLLMRGKFTSGTVTAVEARLNLKLNGSALTSANSTKIPSLQLAGDLVLAASSTTYFRSVVLVEPSVGYVTFATQSSTANSITKTTGTSSSALHSITARIPINGWENSNVIIGTFKDVVTSQGSNTADIQSVYFGSSADCSTACTTGNCTICSQTGTKITSVSFFSTGQYNVNGIDGTKYACTTNGVVPGTGPAIGFHDRPSSSSSLARIRFTTNALAAVDTGNNSVTCIGTP